VTDAGFTLVETLGALAILSLAVSGMVAAEAVYGRQQLDVTQQVLNTEALRAGQAGLERLMAPQGPFRSDQATRFTGSSSQIQFDCGEAAPCVAELVGAQRLALQLTDQGRMRQLDLRTAGPAHFTYESDAGTGLAWPPAPGPLQHLRTVAVVRDSDPQPASLFKARVWREEPLACEFDPVSGDCR
jgi:hypothetical protein